MFARMSACTAGKEICDYAKELYQTDMLKGFLLESFANAVVEAAMDRIQDEMREQFGGEGLLVSNRYSPGYCGWNVAEQKKLFNLLPRDFCGISLSDSALMSPIKSISGFIGIGKEIRYKAYKCKACTQKQCVYRKFVA